MRERGGNQCLCLKKRHLFSPLLELREKRTLAVNQLANVASL